MTERRVKTRPIQAHKQSHSPGQGTAALQPVQRLLIDVVEEQATPQLAAPHCLLRQQLRAGQAFEVDARGHQRQVAMAGLAPRG